MFALYLRLVGARIRAQMQYKVSFWMDLVGFGLVTGLEFATIAILYGRFQSIGGWSIAEVALLYGMVSVAFSLAEMFSRGFDAPFERHVGAMAGSPALAQGGAGTPAWNSSGLAMTQGCFFSSSCFARVIADIALGQPT